MKLIIEDNLGVQHVLNALLELEYDAEDIGGVVLDFVNFIDIEGCCGTVGRRPGVN